MYAAIPANFVNAGWTLSPGGPTNLGASVEDSVGYYDDVLSVTTEINDYSYSSGDSSFQGSAYAYASYGTLKLSSSVNLANYHGQTYSDPTIFSQPSTAMSRFSDTYTISGGTGTGYLKITTVADGSSTAVTTAPDSRAIGINVFSIYKIDSGNYNYIDGFWFTNGTESFVSQMISFNYDKPFQLEFSARTAFSGIETDLSANQLYDFSGTVDYAHTMNLTDFSVYSDANGLNKTNFSLSATSGTAYPISVASVPEADTYAMLLAGLGVLGLVARRKKIA